MRQIKQKLKEGTKIDEAIMWFRIAENGSVSGDGAASQFTVVSPW